MEEENHKRNHDTESNHGTHNGGRASTMGPEAWSQKRAPNSIAFGKAPRRGERDNLF